MALRPAFEAALRLLARASEDMKRRGCETPVLVGGGAVELYSNSAIVTGDFDLVTGRQTLFEEVLQQHGFIRPSGAGKATRGWVHPDLALGFEVVSSTLLDGKAERDRVRLIDLAPDGEIAVLAVEDMIADRMGQYSSGTAREMLEQARSLFKLHADADLNYMEKRIRQESAGEYGVEDINR